MAGIDTDRLEEVMSTLHSAPMPNALPLAPTKRLSDVCWRGDGYGPFSVQDGWPTEPPVEMKEKKFCRRRAVLEYLRHGNLDYLDLAVCIGPNTNKRERLDRLATIKQEVSILNGKLAGKNSFLAKTLAAELMMDNVKVLAHNHYARGREPALPPAGRETAAARAHVAKAERTMAELEAWVEAQV